VAGPVVVGAGIGVVGVVLVVVDAAVVVVAPLVVVDAAVVVGPLVVVVVVVVAAASTLTINWGAVAPVSRLAYTPTDELSSVRTKLTIPLPRTRAVTSTLDQVPRVMEPDLATTDPGVGALAKVIRSSLHSVLATDRKL